MSKHPQQTLGLAKTIRTLYFLFETRERAQAWLLLALLFCMAVVEVAGVASIMPFLAVLGNQSLISTNPTLVFFYDLFEFSSNSHFIFVLGILTLFSLLLSLCIRAASNFLIIHFALIKQYKLSLRLFKSYMYRPYSWYISKNPSDLNKAVLAEVETVISGGLIPAMSIIAQFLSALLLLTLIIVIDPIVALSTGGVVCFCYSIIYGLINRHLATLGQKRYEANAMRFNTVRDAFLGYKVVKLSGLEQHYVQRFDAPAAAYAINQSKAQLYGLMPRYALEAVAFSFLILFVLISINNKADFVSLVPLLSVYAFAGYRLIPALQQIYSGTTNLKFAEPAIVEVSRDLFAKTNRSSLQIEKRQMEFNSRLQLRNVYFRYPNANEHALSNINLDIPKNASIAIVGASGSGKSTLLDIILGLLEPTEGSYFVDQQNLTTDNIYSWQSCIGYVPQSIFVANDSLEANIAFGINPEELDQNLLNYSIAASQLDAIQQRFSEHNKQQTLGDGGIRLSGGQRQRIGIARALYRKPKILIFDEATNALDFRTERLILDTIYKIDKLTKIVITHRVETVRQFDTIVLMQDGQIKAVGNYERLWRDEPSFRALISTQGD